MFTAYKYRSTLHSFVGEKHLQRGLLLFKWIVHPGSNFWLHNFYPKWHFIDTNFACSVAWVRVCLAVCVCVVQSAVSLPIWPGCGAIQVHFIIVVVIIYFLSCIVSHCPPCVSTNPSLTEHSLTFPFFLFVISLSPSSSPPPYVFAGW